MNNNDTLDKIVQTYFGCLATEPFVYKDITYEPQELYVSPLLLRGFTCPENCGGCCFKITLDWIPAETRPDSELINPREVKFNNKSYTIYSDLQNDHDGAKCKNLRMTDGRCMIHGKHPLPCDFELMKFLISKKDKRFNQFTQKLFGRGWNLKRIDGERGAKCEMTPIDKNTVTEVFRKLDRLEAWTNYFELPTKISIIRAWINSLTTYKNIKPIYLSTNGLLIDKDRTKIPEAAELL